MEVMFIRDKNLMKAQKWEQRVIYNMSIRDFNGYFNYVTVVS